VQQCHASRLLLCSAHATLYFGSCAVTAQAPLLFISCLLQLHRLPLRGLSSGPLGCAAASCVESPAILGERYSIVWCVCSDCTCTVLVHKLSITAPSSTSARSVVRAALQQLRASSILLCSAHTLYGCAGAVIAHAPLLVKSCLLQLHRLLQRGLSSGPL
jgi:hypothetical protein